MGLCYLLIHLCATACDFGINRLTYMYATLRMKL